jgi:hypothetical protein
MEIQEIHLAIPEFKLINTNQPNYLASELSQFNYTYETQNINSLVLPRHHTEYFNNSFSYRTASLWSSLPQEHNDNSDSLAIVYYNKSK